MIRFAKSISKEEIETALNASESVGVAALSMGIDKRTFVKAAKQYGIYVAKGIAIPKHAFDLQDILDGKHPQYPTSKLSKRLVKAGIKEYRCERCLISEWNSEPISLELNHIDGNNGNHALVNLELLCPNCHSQTPTYRNKKRVV